ncbi:hypothetical protein PV10_07904 [Exophiala mesophila]|uniref:Uncharacterized protein n=1 Tax=Exophiala mesophila TaxID=212818 RepID=A0A0D1Z9C3_EXOME|nr:uncharacterized protein PV10_07904 [Exophiala mesophila]KIV90619.1 hypothetical protein PV10_07904 [Exophiala mesophila]
MATASSTLYCQICRQPIRLDGTIKQLNPAALDVLIGSTGKPQRGAASASRLAYPQERRARYDRVTAQAVSPIHKRTIPPPLDESTFGGSRGDAQLKADMSFIEITQSQVDLPLGDQTEQKSLDAVGPHETNGPHPEPRQHTLADDISKAERLFSILSSHSDVDHPICTECTAILINGLKARMNNATKERDAYAFFLKNIQQHNLSAPSKDAQSLRARKANAESAYQKLLHVEREVEQTKVDIAQLNEEIRALESSEEAFWLLRNSLDEQLHDATIQLNTLQQSFSHDHRRLERLQRTNVFNDTFCVGHDGSFGTINGLRLGRLPNNNVEWGEINAAWGQTLLLLATVAERLKYVFQGYRLKPQGSISRIEKLDYLQQPPDQTRPPTTARERVLGPSTANPEPKVTVLDLFSSGEMAIGRVLNHRKFDNGMVAFLDCLSQVAKFVERSAPDEQTNKASSQRMTTVRTTPKQPVLPYVIDNDKIGGISIKLGMGFGDAESFTRACKYVLTCCKFLLAYVSNLENQRNV